MLKHQPPTPDNSSSPCRRGLLPTTLDTPPPLPLDAIRLPAAPADHATVERCPLPRWLSVEQIRKMQRCRRGVVLLAMNAGELPFERRGRIRYARLTDVVAWEERRLRPDRDPLAGLVHPDLADFA